MRVKKGAIPMNLGNRSTLFLSTIHYSTYYFDSVYSKGKITCYI